MNRDEDLEDKLISLFQWLHAHPEIGFEEKNTTARLRDELEQAGIEVLDSGLPTGLIARITGTRPGKVIGLRCDIDALPIREESGLPYSSQNEGRMHACGHDSHATIMLGAALLLNRHRQTMRGTVKIIFQPAEEVIGGAQRVMATGLLDDLNMILGVHSYPGFPAGTLGLAEGSVMASVDRFAITIHGMGTHAAEPQRGIDPIVVQAALVQSLQTIVSRSVSPFSHSVVSVTHVESGSTWNVIPETAVLEGTVRTLEPADRTFIENKIRKMTQLVAEAYDAEADVTWIPGPAAVVNDSALYHVAAKAAKQMGFKVGKPEDTMGGEDFSCYLERCPGLFIRVGTGGGYPSHHPRFTVDPSALYPAAWFFSGLTLDLQDA